MSDTISKAEYDRLNSAYMTLQREAEALRRNPSASQVLQQVLLNPRGAFTGAGYGDDAIEHVRNALIADKLGPNAPMPMQIAANQGPIMVQVQQLAGLVKDLADKVNNTSTAHSQYTEREKFKGAITNTSKYPNLAKAYAKNPDKFGAIPAGSSAEDYMAKQEAELKDIAEALGAVQTQTPPDGNTSAASENAEKQGEGKNATIASAQSGLLNDVPVPKSQNSPNGKWNKDTFQGLKERLVAEATKTPGKR